MWLVLRMISQVQFVYHISRLLGTGTWILRCAETWKVSSIFIACSFCVTLLLTCVVILIRNVISLVRCTPSPLFLRQYKESKPLISFTCSFPFRRFRLVIIHLRNNGDAAITGLDVVPLHPDLQNVGSESASRITWLQHNLCVKRSPSVRLCY